MKLGFFGGTFDPVHYGHLRPAAALARELALDRVIFIPNGRSPLKESGPGADSFHRVGMLAIAIEGRMDFSISTVELSRPGLSYTFETLEILAARHPGDELFFLLGTDALAGIARWKNPARIGELARLAAFVREPHTDADELRRGSGMLADRILIFDSTRVTISATDLRTRLAEGKSIGGLTPPGVEEYIAKHGLYSRSAGVAPV